LGGDMGAVSLSAGTTSNGIPIIMMLLFNTKLDLWSKILL